MGFLDNFGGNAGNVFDALYDRTTRVASTALDVGEQWLGVALAGAGVVPAQFEPIASQDANRLTPTASASPIQRGISAGSPKPDSRESPNTKNPPGSRTTGTGLTFIDNLGPVSALAIGAAIVGAFVFFRR